MLASWRLLGFLRHVQPASPFSGGVEDPREILGQAGGLGFLMKVFAEFKKSIIQTLEKVAVNPHL